MLLLLALGLACDTTEPAPAPPAEDCEPSADFTWGTFGAGFFAGRCSGCHGSGAPNRYGAPDAVVFDDEADVWTHRDAVLASVVERGSMPPAGGLTDTEITRLQAWLACRP